MPADDPRAQTAREIAAARLEHAAAQLVAVKVTIGSGNASQAHLRASRGALAAAALAYALALGWSPPTGAA